MTHDDPSENFDQDLRLPSIAEPLFLGWDLDLISVSTRTEHGYGDRDSTAWQGSSYGTQPSLSAATSDVRPIHLLPPLRPLRPSAKPSSSGCDMSSPVSHRGTNISGGTGRRKRQRERGPDRNPRGTKLWMPTQVDQECPICKDFLQDVSRFTERILALRNVERRGRESSSAKRDPTVENEVYNLKALQNLVYEDKDTIKDWRRLIQRSHEGREVGGMSISRIDHKPCLESEAQSLEQLEKSNAGRTSNGTSLYAVLNRQYSRLRCLSESLREESPYEGSKGILQSDNAQRLLQRFILVDEGTVSGLLKSLSSEKAESEDKRADADADISDTEHDDNSVARDLRGPSAWNPINKPRTATD